MGVYSRFKREPDGLRHLVELLESTPASRRKRMIDVGMEEDPEYTQKALQYLLKFEDVMKLPDLEFTEVISEAPARFVAIATCRGGEETKARILARSFPKNAAEIKEVWETSDKVTNSEIGGAQAKLIEVTRKLEKAGIVKTKRIPMQ